ncbi:MAG TPA: hypothetical protein VI670_25030 [Thermoanaerobaculia bacterium]
MRTNRFAVLCCLAALLLLTACEMEDDLTLRADGSGSYRVKLLLPNELALALPEIRSKAIHDGFRVLEEGATADRKFVVLAREFKQVSELNESGHAFDFQSGDAGFLRREARFHASISHTPAFKRVLTITLPGEVKSSTAGDVTGNRIRWDCSNGGSLDAVAVGFYLPLSTETKAVSTIVVVLVLLAAVAVRLRRHVRQSIPES